MKLSIASITFLLYFSANAAIFGEDNRTDTVLSPSAHYRELAKATAALISSDDFYTSGRIMTFMDYPLKELLEDIEQRPLCEGQRFADQVAVSKCSGFLISSDTLVTAGHCYDYGVCDERKWVFNYKLAAASDKTVTVTKNDIYDCKQVLSHSFTENGNGRKPDFAIVRLSRSVKNVKPLVLAKRNPKIGTAVVMIGYPSGLPQKIADDAKVRKTFKTSFMADLDGFSGNSGSAVLDAKSGVVLGVMVHGPANYGWDYAKDCSFVLRHDVKTEIGQSMTGVESILSALASIK